LIVQQNYFQVCIQQNFRSLSKIVLSVESRFPFSSRSFSAHPPSSQPSRLLMTLSADGHHPAQEFEMALILFHALFIYTATWRAIAPIAVRHGFMKSAAKRRP